MSFTAEELAAMAEADAEIEAEFELTEEERKSSDELDREAGNYPRRDYHKRYYEEHKEQVKARNKRYYEAHKEKQAEYRRRYREKNREWLNTKRREYDSRPDVKQRRRERNKSEEAREKNRGYGKKWYRNKIASMMPEERKAYNAERARVYRERRKQKKLEEAANA